MSIFTDPSLSQEAKLDQSIGTPGSAKPGQALQIGGTDGTNLQSIATDSTGAVKLAAGTNNIGSVNVASLPSLPAGTNTIGAVTEANLDASIGSPGSAAPSKAVIVGGTDGTNLHQLFTDNSGRQITYNERVAGPSTTSALAASGSYTSSSVSTAGFSRITGSTFADQAGTLNVQQSPDGTNWDIVSSFSVSANTGTGFSVELVCPYVRLYYVNGATAQTVFRLYSFLRRFA